jgi:tetratricopeptide (TPR) repeat protein/TolB-like protein
VFCSGRRFDYTWSALVLLALAAASFSCSPSKPPGIERIAILRFENVTGDDALNWMGRAVPEVMTAELTGSPTISAIPFNTLHASDRVFGLRPITAPGISTERQAALVAGARLVLYGRISRLGTRLRLDAALFDTSRGKEERTLAIAGPESQGVIPLADSLAKELAAPVRRFGTASDAALSQYCEGLEAPDPAASAAAFSQAVAADPNFGQAYVTWAERTAEQGNRAEAERITALASSRGNSISEMDRARLAALAAELRGDSSGSVQALETAARLDPTDWQLLHRLARMNLNSRRYAEAARDLAKVLAVEPQSASLLNELGYAEMYAGDLSAATKALDEYRRLQPADPNALDSLGDVNFYFGQFDAAERYYRESFEKDASFNSGGGLLKAAHARLRTGDVSRADALFNQYLEVRRKARDPLAEFRYAEWEFLSGRRQQALARMDGLARGLPAGAAQINAQIAVWELELGDRKRARDFAERAQSSGLAAIARFLTESPASPSEWKERARRLVPGAGDERARQLMLAYALLLQKDFASALPVLQDVVQHSPPEPHEILPVLMAWALVETGHFKEAADFVQRNPVPNPAPELFASLAFPRLLFLRATVLEKLGQRDAAAKTLRLFASLSGPDDTR